jgi:hypothetical protein
MFDTVLDPCLKKKVLVFEAIEGNNFAGRGEAFPNFDGDYVPREEGLGDARPIRV